MKPFLLLITSFILIVKFPSFLQAQTNDNEFISRYGYGNLDAANSKTLADKLQEGDKDNIYGHLKNIFNNQTFTDKKGKFDEAVTSLKTAFKRLDDNKTNTGIVVIYRDMFVKLDGNNQPASYDVDFGTINTLIISKDKYKTGLQSYLLETKSLFLVYIDVEDEHYIQNPDDRQKNLKSVTVDIDYLTSFFRQSLKDLIKFTSEIKSMSGPAPVNRLKIIITELSPGGIKPPCKIELQHKSFPENPSFTVHERNLASFQVGLVNNKFNANNFSLSGDTLIVKADSTEKATWKSNLYASLELHFPRDIDRFDPIWKATFKNYRLDRNKAWNRVYKIIFERVGIYAGVKLSKDPLSDIYYGFNYAITKEIYINFGWSRNNQVVPQITQIGNVNSLDDALEYAARDYSKAKFSWGLSFSPSALYQTLGFGDKNKNEE